MQRMVTTPSRLRRSLQETWEQQQKERGLKKTRPREQVVDAFFSAPHHVSVEELLLQVRKKHPHIGYATVYRTLKLLEACGLAESRQFGDGQTRYEIAGPETPHHDHLICTHCGLILEFKNQEIESLQKEVAQKLGGFSIVHHKLELYGLCAKAAGQEQGFCPREQSA